jgi:tripartite-type tricarboxylate transporter receptor subunit TctC
MVENRPGAGGLIGAEALARSAADGYTIGLGTITSHAVAPAIATSVPFDPLREFLPIVLLATAPALFVVHHSVPATGLADYLAYARRRGGSTFTSAGQGSVTHLAGEVLRARYGAPLEHVSYREIGTALADLLAGRIDAMCYQPPALARSIASGILRPLAALSDRRLPLFPTLPTANESLGADDLDFSSWFGVFLPAAADPSVAATLHGAMAAALARPGLRGAWATQGLEPIGWGVERFGAFFHAETVRWRRVVKAAGMAPPGRL